MSKVSKEQIKTTGEEINKVCKDCGRLKDIKNFYKCPNCKGGYNTRCKICFQRRKIEVREPRLKKPRKYSSRNNDMARMTACTKKDYMEMYEFMRNLGFDPNNAHKDFCDKYGLPYKKRGAKEMPVWLPNGERNPLRYTQRGKNTVS